MAVVVTNQSTAILSIPLAEETLRPGETKTFASFEYDLFVNDSRIRDLMTRRLITVASEDEVPFASAWDGEPKFHLGDFHYWVDANGDTRIKYGDAASDTDGDTLGSGSTNDFVLSDHSRIGGRTFAQVRSAFFGWFLNQGMGTWDSIYQYCYWSFASPNSTTWSTPQRFVTQNDLFTWMEANLPSVGDVYSDTIIRFRLSEEVNTSDTFPNTLVHRNSLVACMMGRKKWVSRQPVDRYGVDSNFNNPSYYLNYYNELGIRFVQSATGNTPIVNNDKAIWYANRKRNMWSLPEIGAGINLFTLGQRGGVWDDAATSWVEPAPLGWYSLQQPFILHEYRKNRILGIEDNTGPERRRYEMNAVSALVYPAVMSGRWYAFVVYPLNSDAFVTEWFDTSAYQLQLKLIYGQTNHPVYVSLPGPHFTSGQQNLMWNHFPIGGGNSYLYPKSPGQIISHLDQSTVPSKVYLCRRERTTGIRSRWVPLYNIKRRVPHASVKIEPARFQR